MSTRGIYQFTQGNESFCVYKHSDNYPEGPYGGFAAVAAAAPLAWGLPRFEADEFGAAFVAANKGGGGGVRLTMGATWQEAASLDCEYAYVITAQTVQCFDIEADDNGNWTAHLIHQTPLADALAGWYPSERDAA